MNRKNKDKEESKWRRETIANLSFKLFKNFVSKNTQQLILKIIVSTFLKYFVGVIPFETCPWLQTKLRNRFGCSENEVMQMGNLPKNISHLPILVQMLWEMSIRSGVFWHAWQSMVLFIRFFIGYKDRIFI